MAVATLRREEYALGSPLRGAAAPAVAAPEPAATPGNRRAVRTTPLVVPRHAHVSQFARALWLAGVPALCLVLYVGMWTGAVKQGYARNRLRTQIRALEIENNSLQAELLRLQSPARIFREAGAMNMQRPADITFVEVPSHVAQR